MNTKQLFVINASMDGEVKTFFYLFDNVDEQDPKETFLNSTAQYEGNPIQAYCEEKIEEYQKRNNILIDKVRFEYINLDELDEDFDYKNFEDYNQEE